jgi:hypothetical protein
MAHWVQSLLYNPEMQILNFFKEVQNIPLANKPSLLNISD